MSSYTDGDQRSGEVRMALDLRVGIEGRHTEPRPVSEIADASIPSCDWITTP